MPMIDFNRRPDECAECGGPLGYKPEDQDRPDGVSEDFICDKCYWDLVVIEGTA